MSAALHAVAVVPRTPSPYQRRIADRDAAAYQLVADIVTASSL